MLLNAHVKRVGFTSIYEVQQSQFLTRTHRRGVNQSQLLTRKHGRVVNENQFGAARQCFEIETTAS